MVDAAVIAAAVWVAMVPVGSHELRIINGGELWGFLYLLAGLCFVPRSPRMAALFWGLAVWLVKIIYLPFAAALLAYRYTSLEMPFSNLMALFYTIPSIAFFQIMVPVTGIGWTTVEIALISYTLLILFRNTLTGLREVPEEAKEAAEGMGLTRRQSLVRVELPLALPAIIAGIRVATVTTISLATIGAYITPLGLGAPIFSAIQTGANTEFVAASLLAIALALIADVLIVLLQRALTPWARARRQAA